MVRGGGAASNYKRFKVQQNKYLNIYMSHVYVHHGKHYDHYRYDKLQQNSCGILNVSTDSYSKTSSCIRGELGKNAEELRMTS